MNRHLIVSLHDAHPGSLEDIEGQLTFLAGLGVGKTSILVVPAFHHQYSANSWIGPFGDIVRSKQDAGHELVLHGFFHDRQGQVDTLRNVFWTRLYTNSEAEFLDLPEAEAEPRLRDGLATFDRYGWRAEGFIAPAWLMAPHLIPLLRKLGFRYTNRLTELIPLDGRAPIASQSLCYSTRAAWRRTASLAWNRHLFSRLQNNALLRLSLHPHDLHFPALKNQIGALVKTALQNGFQPTTYREYVAR